MTLYRLDPIGAPQTIFGWGEVSGRLRCYVIHGNSGCHLLFVKFVNMEGAKMKNGASLQYYATLKNC